MTEKKPGLFNRYREHYHATEAEHRPVPVLLPFLATAALVVLAFLFHDPVAARMHGQWPGWLANNAAHVTDVGRSWWILTLAAVVVVATWAFRRFSGSSRGAAVTGKIVAVGFYIFVSVGGAALIANTLKRVIGRPRPVEFPEHGLFSFNPFTWNFNFESFPSGHSAVNGALFMALSMLFPRFRWPLLALGFCLALTRVVIGVHYPSDVTAGFALGVWSAFATALFFSRIGVLFDGRDGRLA